MIRYFTLLSRLNFSIDTNFYPLGSCTMKYNPKLNDQIASLSGFANIHPLQDDESVQGALELMFELQRWLAEATGLPGVGMAPLAGAQGEYAGLSDRSRGFGGAGPRKSQRRFDTRFCSRHEPGFGGDGRTRRRHDQD